MREEQSALSRINAFIIFQTELPHKHKIVIAGNHEITFQEDFYARRWQRFHHKQADSSAARAALTNCTYLEDSVATVEGVVIYGSPWQPRYFDWAFNVRRGSDIRCKWEKIPRNIDILMTHGPPVGYGDNGHDMEHAGCVDLLHVVKEVVQPKFHVFGHLHAGYGVVKDSAVSNAGTTSTIFVNAASCDESYIPNNPPVVFDYELGIESHRE